MRVMGQTGGAAVLSGLLSVAATKIIATMLGPSQVALLATLQQLRTTAVTCGSFAGQTALVQGCSSRSGRSRTEFLRTVACLMAAALCTVMICLFAFPTLIAEQAGLSAKEGPLVTGLGIAVTLGVIYVFLSGILNAAGAVGILALAQLSTPAAMVLFTPLAARSVGLGYNGAFVVLLASASGLAVLIALWAIRKEGALNWFGSQSFWWSTSAARSFFAISGSMFASGLFSSWVLIAARARILHREGFTVGGQFDAAWAISMNQAGLLLASLQTYYLPTLAKITDPQERSALIGRALTLAAISGAALISTMIVLKPSIISALYSHTFAGSAQYLRWTLIGDYLKITSWILSIPLIASANMRTFLLADLIAYGTFSVTAFVLSERMGAAEGTSIAFVEMYSAHLVFCAWRLWRREEFMPDGRTVAIWLGGFLIVAFLSALCWRQV